ncbi:hypothetical protein CBM2608_A330014 [Cupriavidus taiwanensis]|nr:hypothetical protein CBM2608_A330014 [Cupriavidus taiwanensis]SOZ80595.1 hypothetical protein CBM2618_A290128 [Cupriavidus taiwanensis]SPA15690.1 hypothetical protein CBM2631_A330026 [Cupriavidus taiwanensis]
MQCNGCKGRKRMGQLGCRRQQVCQFLAGKIATFHEIQQLLLLYGILNEREVKGDFPCIFAGINCAI